MQNAQLVSELFDDYTVYFPKCYRYFIKEEANPNNKYLILDNEKLHYSNSKEMISIHELKDISNCYVCLQGGQRREDYLMGIFQHLIKRYKWTEDTVEEEYKKIEDN